jgi:uncharacterized repeat protein (TIGR03803 family)
MKRLPILFTLLFCAAIATLSNAQTFTYQQFNGTDGGDPLTAPIQGLNGNLYGTTDSGGTNGLGTVYELEPAGKITTLYNFCSQTNCADGEYAQGIILAANGNFYGITGGGGANNGPNCNNDGCGTVFEITPAGKLTTLYSFCSLTKCADGALPFGSLVQGTNGNFYGTTFFGGVNCTTCGTVFEITPAGKLTTLYSFCSQTNCTDGYQPQAGLVLANDGNFYGTTDWGGPGAYDVGSGFGTVFKISPAGQFSQFYAFCAQQNCPDGWGPQDALIQATDGNLYGTASGGGAYDEGVAFKLTLSGEQTVLLSFCQTTCADGQTPTAPLIQASDGNFYGTTYAGALHGNIYQLTPSGTATTLYAFCSTGVPCLDGYSPRSGLTQYTDGTFYGTAEYGGKSRKLCFGGSECGTVYSLATGLEPFILSNPVFGKIGYKINILGNNLTGATSVTFNGTAATFTVVSNTRIEATVPGGATSGTIQVTTPVGTLSSSVAFQVE